VAHGLPRLARLRPKPINPSALPKSWKICSKHLGKMDRDIFIQQVTSISLQRVIYSQQPTATVYTSERHQSKINSQKLLQKPQYQPLNLASLLGLIKLNRSEVCITETNTTVAHSKKVQ
jgi:hypothetical protein